MNPLLCFACARSFCFTYYTVFISTHEISHFYISDSLPHATVWGVIEWLVVLSCLPG